MILFQRYPFVWLFLGPSLSLNSFTDIFLSERKLTSINVQIFSSVSVKIMSGRLACNLHNLSKDGPREITQGSQRREYGQ